MPLSDNLHGHVAHYGSTRISYALRSRRCHAGPIVNGYVYRPILLYQVCADRPGVLRTSSHVVPRPHYNTPSRLASHSIDIGTFRCWDSSVSIVTKLRAARPSKIFRCSVWERNYWCLLSFHAGSAHLKGPRAPITLSSRVKRPELEDDHSSTISTILRMNGIQSPFQHTPSWSAKQIYFSAAFSSKTEG